MMMDLTDISRRLSESSIGPSPQRAQQTAANLEELLHRDAGNAAEVIDFVRNAEK
jgi:hypothetical protein